MRRLLKNFVPRPLKRFILENETIRRQQAVDRLAKVPIQKKHIENCELVLNRFEMLQRLGSQAVVAELGVNRGEFSETIIQELAPEKLHLVDIWHTERYNDGLYREIQAKFATEIESGKVEIHRDLSTDAAPAFADDYFDLVYIDTDHSYETTRDELNAYASKVKPNGILSGHDYSMGNWVGSFRYGVIEAVHEFCVQSNWELRYLTCEPLESQSFAIRRIQ
ncbi:class I SAM-dependent methyltransferase [Planctomycetes bacterium K23_9]|uniref:Uncharacterized protein n=1 Tax=Stieleria marina TaxID=1930275 RepID=A0A517NML3_9BACT|nr:hypothetical protein K239x_03020 [Planctomycetes bacterium K23_9]